MSFRRGHSLQGSRYVIERQIGEGGMGFVFKAIDTRLKRPVALKCLRPNLLVGKPNKGLLTRFDNEGVSAAQIDHPNVVRVYDSFEHDGIPVIVMEYVDGIPATLLALPPSEALRVLGGVVKGLIAAHEKGVIHRDIKPGNILIDRRTRTVKITDFGIARVEAAPTGMTRINAEVGTPEYMAPEQLTTPDQIDARVDIYATCATLRTLCVGHNRAHVGGFFAARSLVDDDAEFFKGISPELVAIINRGTAMHPKKRYANADELLRAIEAAQMAIGPVDNAEIDRLYTEAFADADTDDHLDASEGAAYQTIVTPVPDPPPREEPGAVEDPLADPEPEAEAKPKPKWPFAVAAVVGLALVGMIGWAMVDHEVPVDHQPVVETSPEPIVTSAKIEPSIEVTPTPPVVVPPAIEAKVETKVETKAPPMKKVVKTDAKVETKVEAPPQQPAIAELTIAHTPLTAVPNGKATFTAQVSGPVSKVILFIFNPLDKEWQNHEMTGNAGTYSVTVKLADDLQSDLRYYIEAHSSDGKKVQDGTFRKPHVVTRP